MAPSSADSQVWSRLQQLDQILDDRDMPSRLLRCLITGGGGQNNKSENHGQHGYPPLHRLTSFLRNWIEAIIGTPQPRDHGQ